MGGEHGGDLRRCALEVQNARARHPLVEMGDDLVHRVAVVVVETLDDTAGGVAEEGRLDVVPLPGNGVQLVGEPELGEDVVLLLEEGGEIDEDHHGRAADVPAPHAHLQSLLQGGLAPVAVKFLVLDEVIIVFLGDVRTHAEVVVVVLFDHCGGLG